MNDVTRSRELWHIGRVFGKAKVVPGVSVAVLVVDLDPQRYRPFGDREALFFPSLPAVKS